MTDARRKNVNWSVQNHAGMVTYDGIQVAVLMDIRDELQDLNRLLRCPNFLAIPRYLRAVKLNTAKPKPRPKRKRKKRRRKK